MPSGSASTIQREPYSSNAASVEPARAERDEALHLRVDRVADDEVEVHAVLRDLVLGHLLEHELRTVHAAFGTIDR